MVYITYAIKKITHIRRPNCTLIMYVNIYKFTPCIM